MPLSLWDVQRIASDEATQQDPAFEIVAVTPAGHESSYLEVILARRDQVAERRFLILGVFRDSSESDCRRDVRERLQAQRAQR